MLEIELNMGFYENADDIDVAVFGKQCDRQIDASTLKELFSRSERSFPDRKEFCKALGIGESTLSGWIKEGRVPRMVKIVIGLLLLAKEISQNSGWKYREIHSLAYGARLVRDGENFMIIVFEEDTSLHKTSPIGKIIARGIPDEESGRKLLSFQKMKQVLVDVYKTRSGYPETKHPQWDDHIDSEIFELVEHHLPPSLDSGSTEEKAPKKND